MSTTIMLFKGQIPSTPEPTPVIPTVLDGSTAQTCVAGRRPAQRWCHSRALLLCQPHATPGTGTCTRPAPKENFLPFVLPRVEVYVWHTASVTKWNFHQFKEQMLNSCRALTTETPIDVCCNNAVPKVGVLSVLGVRRAKNAMRWSSIHPPTHLSVPPLAQSVRGSRAHRPAANTKPHGIDSPRAGSCCTPRCGNEEQRAAAGPRGCPLLSAGPAGSRRRCWPLRTPLP